MWPDHPYACMSDRIKLKAFDLMIDGTERSLRDATETVVKAEIDNLEGGKIHWIKLVRELLGCSLSSAKVIVERHEIMTVERTTLCNEMWNYLL